MRWGGVCIFGGPAYGCIIYESVGDSESQKRNLLYLLPVHIFPIKGFLP